jgi:hypothetical protein
MLEIVSRKEAFDNSPKEIATAFDNLLDIFLVRNCEATKPE